MASQHQVKQYLAYWFQLGKRVIIRNGEEVLQPNTVFAGDGYSQEFERCWQTILSPSSGDCYVEGTNETIADLLTPVWDIDLCARCAMPIPLRRHGMPPECCPCFDILNWPNNETLQPRAPISDRSQLINICQRLIDKDKQERASGE